LTGNCGHKDPLSRAVCGSIYITKGKGHLFPVDKDSLSMKSLLNLCVVLTHSGDAT
jgi:hypothetical protein